MLSVVDRNVVMRRIPVIVSHPPPKVPCLVLALLPLLFFFISLFISKPAHLFLTVPYQSRAECEVNGFAILYDK